MDWLQFLPPFFGVLAAFLIQRIWSWFEDRDNKKKLLQGIKKELERCSELLVGKGNIVPTDLWKSGVSSGSLKLIPHDHKIELAEIYFKIECHNFDAEKVFELMILASTDKDKARPENQWIFSDTQKLYNTLSNRLVEKEAALRKEIDDLLKQDSWN
jgi:hypothetical protein